MDQPNFGNKKRKPSVPAQPGQTAQPAPNPASAPAEQAGAGQQTASREDGFALPQRGREVHPKRVWPD